MNGTLQMVGLWLLIILAVPIGFFTYLVIPWRVMSRLTRGIEERHPLLRRLLLPLPSVAILAFGAFIALTHQQLESPHPHRVGSSAPPAPPPPAPSFPWPPPTPSARLVIPKEAFPVTKTVGQTVSYLESALNRTGYFERSFYIVPGGIAEVTRLEHIHADGKPFEEPYRWSSGDEYRQNLSLSEYLGRLFAVDEGYYRVVVFVLTDQAFGSSDSIITPTEATHWLSHGYNTLPADLTERPMSDARQCTALIYEFQKPHGLPPLLLLPSPVEARQHLIASGLLTALMNNASGVSHEH
jgi:hypothetical protein